MTPNNAQTGQFPRTEDDLSRMLIDKVRYRCLYHKERRRWLAYDGRHWLEDGDVEIRKAASELIRTLPILAMQQPEDDRPRCLRFCAKAQNVHMRNAIIDGAEPYLTVSGAIFDQNPYQLNVLNGTLDLRSGVISDHQALDYLMHLANVAYDPNATAPAWKAFVKWTACDRDDMVTYLQDLFGSCLTGDARDQLFHIAWGKGGNGKGVTFHTLEHLMGSYYATVSTDTVIDGKRNQGAATPDLMKLKGARMAVIGESNDGDQLAIGRVKNMTGGDTVTGRHLFGDQETFPMTAKIVIHTNHKPGVSVSDDGVQRRLRLLPYENKAETPDNDLESRLADESCGILNWMLVGCRRWQAQRGISPSETISQSSRAYLADQNSIGQFAQEHLVQVAHAYTRFGDIYVRYKEFCEANGQHPRSARRFADALAMEGFTAEIGHARMKYYRGIGLRSEDDYETPPPTSPPPVKTVPKHTTPDVADEPAADHTPDVLPQAILTTFTIPNIVSTMLFDRYHVKPPCQTCGKVSWVGHPKLKGYTVCAACYDQERIAAQ